MNIRRLLFPPQVKTGELTMDITRTDSTVYLSSCQLVLYSTHHSCRPHTEHQWLLLPSVSVSSPPPPSLFRTIMDPEGLFGLPQTGHIARREFPRRLERDAEGRPARKSASPNSWPVSGYTGYSG